MRRNQIVLLLTGVLALMTTAAANAQVVINEVLQNPEGSSDETWEYIELYGRPGMDLTGYAIMVIKGGRDLDDNGVFDVGEEVPEIDEAFSLDGLSLGANGFLVLYNDTGGFSNLIDLNLIDPAATIASFNATHIPSTDVAGKLGNDGSSTYVLVRKRFDHSINGSGQSVYGPDYAVRKDVRHDVNADGVVDFGTEVNLINTFEPAMRVEPYQMVDDLAWSHDNGREYHRDPQFEIEETPGFNPDMVSRLRNYLSNPQRGYATRGNAGGPFTIQQTSIADESFIYGEMTTSFPGPGFFEYTTATDPVSGYIRTKAPTDPAATPYSGSCDPEPDNQPNPGCAASAGGAYHMTDLAFVGFKLTPGTFNDHPTDANLRQFRFVHGDFNNDGQINQIDRRLIEDRVGRTLDDTEPATYDPTPGQPLSGDEVAYDRYLRQGVEFQLVLHMREMDTDDGPGGTNAEDVTQDDVAAFLALCPVCGNVGTPPAVRITEYLYSGLGGEFVEFTNLSGGPVDLTGWSYSDNARLAGHVDLSAFGVVQDGESVVLTEIDRALFAVRWGLSGVKIIGDVTVNLSRNDEINLYDASGNLANRLTYGDQDFPGSIRTQRFSGWPCDTAVGANAIANWRLSLIGGDAQSSFFSSAGDVGSPGSFALSDCSTTIAVGACCTAGICASGPGITQAFCQQTGGIYQGDDVSCGSVTCPQPSNAVVRITEYMYSSPGGEFIEITNMGATPVDMTGWSYDDSARIVGAFSLSAFGTLAAGESAVITDADAAAFRTFWGLAGSVKVIGNLGLAGVGNNLGRNDEINIFDASGAVVDRLTYGDENFPGTVRTQNASGWPCNFAVGANDITGWVLSAVADAQGSVTLGGATGRPGSFTLAPCAGGDPIGACCNLDGTCNDALTQVVCESGGGTWQGADTLCANVQCSQPSGPMMRITEWMYSPVGTAGEFVEFTNIGATPVDMTGWSYDDDSRIPTTVSLSAFGVVAPGESVILAESDATVFRTEWGLAATVKVIGLNGTNLGRNDEINLFDATNTLVDRLTFGDQLIPGSIRTQGATGWTCLENLGANDVITWQLSVVADAQNSIAATGGDVGNPGSYVQAPCVTQCCPGDQDEDYAITIGDIPGFVNCVLGNTPVGDCGCSDMNGDSVMNGLDIGLFAAVLVNSPGACP